MAVTTANTDAHVAVLAFPFGTHAGPLLAVVARLAAAAPKTLFSFFNTSRSNNSIFSTSTHRVLPNLKAYTVLDGVPQGYVFVGKPQEDIELFLKAAPDSFREGILAAEAETGRKVSCLVTDAFFWFAAEMAKEMAVPWVPFWTAGPISLSAHVYTDLIRETLGVGEERTINIITNSSSYSVILTITEFAAALKAIRPTGFVGREDETVSFIPGMSKILVRDLPEGVLFGNLESLFSRTLHQLGKSLPEATAVFINSFEGIDSIITDDLKSKLKKFLNVGPFNLVTPPPPSPDMHGCLTWLHDQQPASVAYISFGTVKTPAPSELVALAEGLEASKVPFLWSLRDDAKVHLPNGFIERSKDQGLVLPWAPQLEVLAHGATGVFVTHCGWNSVVESIACGVPMICRPFFGDQRLNGRYVEEVLNIGRIVDGGVFTKNGLMRCLDLILSRDEGAKMKEKSRKLRELAQKAVARNGSSTENFGALLELVARPRNA